jgi:hypothetical protein
MTPEAIGPLAFVSGVLVQVGWGSFFSKEVEKLPPTAGVGFAAPAGPVLRAGVAAPAAATGISSSAIIAAMETALASA